ncbi:hypothetical protein F5Y16DRAFT_396277 [Xylariaceae sp. FL0255]|nr:hypothetical protein F5Y16DRAFT_396277 [Xylariaceae sp. FL0255]
MRYVPSEPRSWDLLNRDFTIDAGLALTTAFVTDAGILLSASAPGKGYPTFWPRGSVYIQVFGSRDPRTTGDTIFQNQRSAHLYLGEHQDCCYAQSVVVDETGGDSFELILFLISLWGISFSVVALNTFSCVPRCLQKRQQRISYVLVFLVGVGFNILNVTRLYSVIATWAGTYPTIDPTYLGP